MLKVAKKENNMNMFMLKRTFWLMHDNAAASGPLVYVKSSQNAPNVMKPCKNSKVVMAKRTFLVDA